MLLFPNAKINLGLSVVSKRPDGYHNLETIFFPVPLTDCVEIIPSEEMKFTVSGIAVDCSLEDNLCIKAYRLLQNEYPKLPSVHIHLDKRIPFGAGLGGGSADASFVLTLLNDMFSLGASKELLAKLAGQIGADCPFFIYNKPMFAQGTGDILSELDVNLSGYHLVLVKPDIHINTATAYSGIIPQLPEHDIRETIKLPVHEWKGKLVNDFEQSVFSHEPEIGNIKQQLYDLGADFALMSGSGSTVFGLFRSVPTDIKRVFGGLFVFQATL